MPKRTKSKIHGLQERGLTLRSLRALGSKPVRFSLWLRDIPMSSLARTPVHRRMSLLKEVLGAQRARVEKALSRKLDPIPSAVEGLTYILEGSASARDVAVLARHADVSSVTIRSIKGVRSKRVRSPNSEWYSVQGLVHIRVEGIRLKKPKTENRWVLVRAKSKAEAVRKLKREWKNHAEPYLNDEGRFVRWQLERVVGVDCIGPEIDPNGTEVAYVWNDEMLRGL